VLDESNNEFYFSPYKGFFIDYKLKPYSGELRGLPGSFKCHERSVSCPAMPASADRGAGSPYPAAGQNTRNQTNPNKNLMGQTPENRALLVAKYQENAGANA
jgi:hypothetical protein